MTNARSGLWRILTIIRMLKASDITLAEIATTLGLSVNTVKTHLQRGLDTLGTTLEDQR